MNSPSSRSTIRGVPPDLSRSEVKEEGNLLIEAVSLLVQRQRETESWVAEQMWQAEQRASDAERRYAELDMRLAGIEEHVARLVHDVEPSRQDAAVEERLTRLREQIEGLKSTAGDGLSARSVPLIAAAAHGSGAGSALPGASVAEVPMVREPEPARQGSGLVERRQLGAPAPATPGASVSFWQLLGPTPEARFSVLLFFAGAVAILYALLLLVRF
jgi:hypothetical protein